MVEKKVHASLIIKVKGVFCHFSSIVKNFEEENHAQGN